MFFLIKNQIWRVQFVNPYSLYLLMPNGIFTLGVTDNQRKTIYISQDLSKQLLWKVLCHEIVHAFCFEYNYILDLEFEEFLADFISSYGTEIVNVTNYVFKGI